MTNEKTVTDLTAQVETMAAALGRAGLLPAEVKKIQPLTDEERQAREAALDSAESEWRTASERIQTEMDEAQARYDAARVKMNAANDDLQRLRADLTRGTEAFVELRDRARKDLA